MWVQGMEYFPRLNTLDHLFLSHSTYFTFKKLLCTPPNKIVTKQTCDVRGDHSPQSKMYEHWKKTFKISPLEPNNSLEQILLKLWIDFGFGLGGQSWSLTPIVRVWKIQMPWNSAAQQGVVDVVFFFHYSAKTVQLTLV